MSKMLKPNERIASSEVIKKYFFAHDGEGLLDIVVGTYLGICTYYDVPVDISEERFPNNEISYILGIWWSKASRKEQISVAPLFPNYPGKAEYKSYFHYFRIFEKSLTFRSNGWKEDQIFYILKQTDGKHNDEMIRKLVEVIRNAWHD